MRIDQLQKLCLVGNVLLFGGMVYVGFLFYGAQTSRADVRTVEWPEDVKVRNPVSTWPPPMPQFVHIWKTPVNGLVPETPKTPGPLVLAPKDPWAEFKKQITYRAAWVYLADSFRTQVQFEYPKGQEITLRMGQKVGNDWQFVGFRQLPRENITSPEKIELSFRFVGSSDTIKDKVFTDTFTGPKPELTDPLFVPFEPKFADPIDDKLVSENDLAVQAFRSSPDEPWVLPRTEMAWWRAYGAKAMAAAKAQFQAGNDTVRQGVLFTDSLSAHPALLGERGVRAGDLVAEIDGRAVESIDDLLRYFQGRVAGVERFSLTVVTGGQERQERYLLEQLRAAD